MKPRPWYPTRTRLAAALSLAAILLATAVTAQAVPAPAATTAAPLPARLGQLLDRVEKIDEKDAIAFMKLNIASVLIDQGDLSGGTNLLDESLAYQRQSGNASDVAEALNNLAGALS